MIVSYKPAIDETLARFTPHDGEALVQGLARASAAQRTWARMPVAERMPHLRAMARVLREQKAQLARLMTLEMGKPLAEAMGKIEKCAWNFDVYADAAPGFLQDQIVGSSATDSRIVYDQLGLVLAVMPWYYPFWQVMCAAAPVLVCGNALVLKHASNVPQCALAIEAVFARAGLPEGLVSTLLVGAAAVPALIADRRIAAVTFTGSTPAGRSIASHAGLALKKQVLELGGCDPFIVLADADADIATAATVAVKARLQNTGQSCIGPSSSSSRRPWPTASSRLSWPPRASCWWATRCRPAARRARWRASACVTNCTRRCRPRWQKARACSRGGSPMAGRGAFYQPTVFDHVTPTMTVACQETFGPAAAILRVRDADEAVRVANGTPLGLGAALWAADLDRAAVLTRHIDAGAVFVNGMVASRPAAALRRHQGVGLRARGRHAGPARVLQHQDGVDRPGEMRPLSSLALATPKGARPLTARQSQIRGGKLVGSGDLEQLR